jgi:ABC-type sugar transport system ATPase subunit
MATVQYDGATRQFDKASDPAVDSLDLDIADGEFLVLVGPSGCGKSTSLRMLAGLEPIDRGAILIDGKNVVGTRARDRDVAMVFQSYALYPNMTAEENMAFALRNAKMGKDEIRRRVSEAAEILELQPLLSRKPAKMSGGQRQRVAMGRAIVRDPKVFCMDEPLSNLDAQLRLSTRSQIASLQRRLGTTTVYVTHDQVEAMTMGDRVAVLLDGKLQQVAPPEELYDHPVNTFVAGFIGSPGITLIDGVPVRNGSAWLGAGTVELPMVRELASGAGDRVTLGIRPESWDLAESDAPDALQLRVELLEALGSESYAYCTLVHATEGTTIRSNRVAVRVDKHLKPRLGDVISARPRVKEAYYFDAETGRAVQPS